MSASRLGSLGSNLAQINSYYDDSVIAGRVNLCFDGSVIAGRVNLCFTLRRPSIKPS